VAHDTHLVPETLCFYNRGNFLFLLSSRTREEILEWFGASRTVEELDQVISSTHPPLPPVLTGHVSSLFPY